jgi:predicted transposase/invertase (TIGR01784 family)
MALSRFLDPKNDIAFKKIFGAEKNKHILIHFLNDILCSFKKSKIIDVEFLPTILNPEVAIQKQSIVDVLCKDENGTKYIIEMQVSATKGFEKRAQYYAAKVYGNQAKIGEEYHDLKEIIFLAIADYVIFPNKPHYKSDHIILDKLTYEQDLKDFFFTFIELPKFNKSKEELSSIEEKWCYFFKHAHETTETDLLKIIGSDNIIHKAYTILNRFYWTEKELMAYEEMKRARMDHKAILEYKIDEGKAIGEVIGIKKGRIEGKAEGKIEMAKQLLQNGVGIDLIAQSSGLSKEQIEDLRKYILDETKVVNF